MTQTNYVLYVYPLNGQGDCHAYGPAGDPYLDQDMAETDGLRICGEAPMPEPPTLGFMVLPLEPVETIPSA